MVGGRGPFTLMVVSYRAVTISKVPRQPYEHNPHLDDIRKYPWNLGRRGIQRCLVARLAGMHHGCTSWLLTECAFDVKRCNIYRTYLSNDFCVAGVELIHIPDELQVYLRKAPDFFALCDLV